MADCISMMGLLTFLSDPCPRLMRRPGFRSICLIISTFLRHGYFSETANNAR